MANFKLLLLVALAIPLRPFEGCAQDAAFTRFAILLSEAGVDYLAPADAGYSPIRIAKNSFQRHNFAVYSREEQLEIRFLIEPLRDSQEVSPHLRAMTLVTHLATNDEGAAIAVHSLPPAPYHADWSKAFYFQPKPLFSHRKHCKIIALYKEGRGMAFVFYLFDEANEAVDEREMILQFLE